VKIGVTFDIKVTHKSIGMTNQSWESNRIKFVEKYKESLPLEINGKLFYSDTIVKVKKEPKLAIIIPTKSKLHLLFDCIDSILTVSNYKNYNIYIADTGSSLDEKEKIKTKYSSHSNIKPGRNY
jgi:cellulose synthase/poly-beta-1,6-N-acetylglucosamine synthase-like glycosyltransferase